MRIDLNTAPMNDTNICHEKLSADKSPVSYLQDVFDAKMDEILGGYINYI